MSGEEGKPSSLFLDDESIMEILEKASKFLFLSPSEEVVQDAFQLIKDMKKDLIKLNQLPLHNVEPFKSHDTLTLKEIDDFYKQREDKTFVTPHTIN